ncbi:cytidine deaminase [Roseibium litorale]|uniref:Cytidine deaminase n=1 Tax=Roseibium litorale TaxID=2803841 RepID=A0ABR9CPY0_9HYPH|nr:cytidine deaminase [Roseibium litorale]MBD8892347.1 cytidine deaminase [Roseibium litorale]
MSAVQTLFETALNAQKAAYAPYSRFKVGAAILADDGKVYAGCNVENAAFPEGTCAEAGAIAAMILGGGSRIAEAVVVGDAALCTPCGGCRQKLKEFSGDDVVIHVANLDGIRRSFTMAELLPAGFELEQKD